MRSQSPSPTNSSWFVAFFIFCQNQSALKASSYTRFYLAFLLLNVSQSRILNCYKVTELGCIKYIPPKLDRVRDIYFSFYNSSCIYSNHAIMFLGGKALPEIKENTFIGKRGKALCLFYQNLLCSNYKV